MNIGDNTKKVWFHKKKHVLSIEEKSGPEHIAENYLNDIHSSWAHQIDLCMLWTGRFSKYSYDSFHQICSGLQCSVIVA